MAHGDRVCACCGSFTGIERHHLYLKSEGCPDDLTVWLCHVCHGRTHGLSRRIDIGRSVRTGLTAAKARGVKLGNPKGHQIKRADVGTARGRITIIRNANIFADRLRPVLDELRTMSARSAARELTRRGYATPRGGHWTASSVMNIRRRLGKGGA
jgi:hypothetical protein